MFITKIKNILNKIQRYENVSLAEGHKLEDKLYERFIRYVAVSSTDPKMRKNARLVLSSKKIKIRRWYE